MFVLVRLKKRTIIGVLGCILAVFIAVYATSVAAISQQLKLPVLMYHSVLKDEKYQGKYVISPKALEEDMVYLKENGYTAIGGKELLAYIENGTPLPEKPVILSFDDGYYNNYLYAYPLAKKYGMKIIISPIGYYSDQCTKSEEKLSPNYSHCTWHQIKEMYDSGLVEFGNHSYNLHKSEGARLGTKRLAGEGVDDYRELLRKDIGAAQGRLKEYLGTDTNIFVYPFGAVSKEAPEIIEEMGFKIGFSCEEHMNTISRDPKSLLMLGRFLRTPQRSAQSILQ